MPLSAARTRPAGQTTTTQVEGFGPLNEGVQSAIDYSVARAQAAFVRAGIPALTTAVKTEVLPVLLRDTTLQKRLGIAAGEEAAKRLAPALYVAAGALAVLAGVGVYAVVQNVRGRPALALRAGGAARRR